VSLSHQPLKILKDKIVIVTTTAELLEIYNHVPKLLDRRIISDFSVLVETAMAQESCFATAPLG
jgi:hypothetical protein